MNRLRLRLQGAKLFIFSKNFFTKKTMALYPKDGLR